MLTCSFSVVATQSTITQSSVSPCILQLLLGKRERDQSDTHPGGDDTLSWGPLLSHLPSAWVGSLTMGTDDNNQQATSPGGNEVVFIVTLSVH